jgi:quercetin dioxygenase-like cupin family protein
MNRTEFEQQLKSEGFTAIETKDYAPRPANDAHGHDFSVRGLVLEGAFTVVRDKAPVTYRAGQIFDVAAGTPHSEEIGSEGARVLVGRKY